MYIVCFIYGVFCLLLFSFATAANTIPSSPRSLLHFYMNVTGFWFRASDDCKKGERKSVKLVFSLQTRIMQFYAERIFRTSPRAHARVLSPFFVLALHARFVSA